MDRFGKLWIGMGDSGGCTACRRTGTASTARSCGSTGTAAIPSDNPVIAGTRNAVYSMGHRNPQGIAIRPGTDQVYAIGARA